VSVAEQARAAAKERRRSTATTANDPTVGAGSAEALSQTKDGRVSGVAGWLERAWKLYGQREFEQAERLLRHAARLAPEEAEIWHLLGLVHHEQLDFGKAHQCLRRAIELEPQRAELHLALGRLCLEAGLQEEGLESLQAAVQHAPQNGELHYLMGKVLLQYGNLIGARLRLQAWQYLGLTCQQQGDLESAERCFARVLELRPEGIEAAGLLRQVRDLKSLGDEAA
jgi:tetratricopeptide (TPR) repeat protein